jgi:hypothetical protein
MNRLLNLDPAYPEIKKNKQDKSVWTTSRRTTEYAKTAIHKICIALHKREIALAANGYRKIGAL